MNASRIWTCLAIMGLVAGSALAQGYQDEPDYYEDDDRAGRSRSDGPPQLLFTDEIIDLAIDRIMDQMAEHYAFDENQLYDARDVVKSRFPQFISENRTAIVGVINDYLAAMLGAEAPDPEWVAEWTQRAQPLLGQFLDLVDESADEMDTFMTDEQRVKLAGERAMLDVARNYVTERFDRWAVGGYDPEVEWHGNPGFREQEMAREQQLRDEQETARAEAVGERLGVVGAQLDKSPEDTEEDTPEAKTSRPTAGAKDEWERYVEDFIQRYQLDEGQQNAAHKILTSLQGYRDKYLRRKAKDIEVLEQRLVAAKTDTDRDKVRTTYERLNAPLDRYFQQLKDRLDRIPTRKQRAAAAESYSAPPAEKTESSPKPE